MFFSVVADSKAQVQSSEHKLTKDLSIKVKSVPPNEKVRVIITLKKPTGQVQAQAARGSVKGDIKAKGGKVKREYTIFEGMAAEVPASKVAALANNPNVELIVEDRPVRAFLTESVPLINADNVWNKMQVGANITGKGQTVCVIDSGVDYNHPDLNDSYIGGYDFVNNDDDPVDDYGHGTHVAGIVAANGTLRGVAPDANIIAIKALDANGSGYDSWILSGIDWCVGNASTYDITVISMSLGGDLYTAYCDNEVQETNFKNSINAAVASNITVVVATGNGANYNAIASPACIQNATRVGATYDDNVGGWNWGGCIDSTTSADEITCFTNRGPNFPDILLAPGAIINSTNVSNGYGNMGGTSQSTPHVSGLIALLNQEYRAIHGSNPTPGHLFDVMNSTGVSISDSETGKAYSRIDALAAYNAMDNVPPSITFVAPTPSNNSNVSQNYVFVNVTADELLSTALLEWNGTNETMSSSSGSWYKNKTGLPDGTHTYRVWASDIGGNWNVTDARVITIDTTGPVITMHSPTNTTINDSTPLLNATFDEIVNATWYNNGTADSSPYYGVSNLTLNLTALADGLNNITVYANDSLGNLNYSMRYFTVDVLPPEINISNPADGTTIGVFNNTINGTVFDVVSTIQKVNLTGNGTGMVEVDVVNGGFTYDISYVNGSNTIIFNATDNIGHIGSANVTVTVIKELDWEVNTTSVGGTFMWDVNAGYFDTQINLSTGSQQVNGTLNITGHALPGDAGSSVMDVNAGSLEGHLGKFLEINVGDNLNETSNNLTWAVIQVYYREEEVNAAKLAEDSLALYWDNGTTWKILNSSWDWVHNTSINTTDVGEYSGYVWANLSHFSTYSVAGRYKADLTIDNVAFSNSNPTEGDSITMNVTVNNTNATDAGNFTIEFLVDGASQTNNTLSVKNNSTNSTLFTWTSVKGVHNITIVADVDNVIDELNETNNNVTEEITVNERTTTPSTSTGGGGPPAAKDVAVTATVQDGKATVTFSKISSGKTGTITIPETAEIPFKELAIKVKNTVLNTKIEIYKLDEKPSSISEDISTGVTHSYIQIDETNIVAADIDTVTIKFKVPVSWINDNKIDTATVVLNRYADGKWNALTTTKTSEDSSYVHFSAASPGLSTFGISGEKKSVEMPSFPMVTTVPPTKAPVTTMPPTSAAQTLAPPLIGEPSTPIMMIALAILAIGIIASVAYYKFVMGRDEDKSKIEEQKESEEACIRPVAKEPKE